MLDNFEMITNIGKDIFLNFETKYVLTLKLNIFLAVCRLTQIDCSIDNYIINLLSEKNYEKVISEILQSSKRLLVISEKCSHCMSL